MRVRIKVTDLTEPQWTFVQRFVSTEYPLDGTAVRVCYEYAPAVEFTTIMPLAKFDEIQEHLRYIDKFGWDATIDRIEDDRDRSTQILELIRKMSATIDEMRADLREATGRE